MITYGRIDKGELIIEKTKDLSYVKEAEISKEIKDIPKDCKPVQYAPIPEFDQEKQAVFQVGAVDMGSKIEVGVEVREVKQDDVVEIGPIIKDPIVKS